MDFGELLSLAAHNEKSAKIQQHSNSSISTNLSTPRRELKQRTVRSEAVKKLQEEKARERKETERQKAEEQRRIEKEKRFQIPKSRKPDDTSKKSENNAKEFVSSREKNVESQTKKSSEKSSSKKEKPAPPSKTAMSTDMLSTITGKTMPCGASADDDVEHMQYTFKGPRTAQPALSAAWAKMEAQIQAEKREVMRKKVEEISRKIVEGKDEKERSTRVKAERAQKQSEKERQKSIAFSKEFISSKTKHKDLSKEFISSKGKHPEHSKEFVSSKGKHREHSKEFVSSKVKHVEHSKEFAFSKDRHKPTSNEYASNTDRRREYSTIPDRHKGEYSKTPDRHKGEHSKVPDRHKGELSKASHAKDVSSSVTRPKSKPIMKKRSNMTSAPLDFTSIMKMAENIKNVPTEVNKKAPMNIPKKKNDRPMTQEQKDREARKQSQEYKNWLKFGQAPKNVAANDIPVKNVAAKNVPARRERSHSDSFSDISDDDPLSVPVKRNLDAKIKSNNSHSKKTNSNFNNSKHSNSSSNSKELKLSNSKLSSQFPQPPKNGHKSIHNSNSERRDVNHRNKHVIERHKGSSASNDSRYVTNKNGSHSKNIDSNNSSSSIKSRDRYGDVNRLKSHGDKSKHTSRNQHSVNKDKQAMSHERSDRHKQTYDTSSKKAKRQDYGHENVLVCGPSSPSPPMEASNPFDRIVGEIKKRNPNRESVKRKRRIMDSESEDEEMADFIDDGEEELNDPSDLDYSKYIRQIFGYDKRRYNHVPDDDLAAMESNYATVMKEEATSAKMGLLEDLEDMKMEQDELRRKAMRKKVKTKHR